MSDSQIFSAYQNHSDALEQSLAINAGRLEEYAKTLADAFTNGQRLIIVASGSLSGVAATLANAFLCRLEVERPPLPVVDLVAPSGLALIMVAAGEQDQLVSCQLKAQANAGDCVCFLDCSNNAMLCEGLKTAQELGCATCIFTYADENIWKAINPDVVLPLVTESAARGAEAVLFFGHVLCELVEAELFGF